MKTENLQKVHSGNKLLTGEIGEREDKDYKTHLARISSAGQGLCNNYVVLLFLHIVISVITIQSLL